MTEDEGTIGEATGSVSETGGIGIGIGTAMTDAGETSASIAMSGTGGTTVTDGSRLQQRQQPLPRFPRASVRSERRTRVTIQYA